MALVDHNYCFTYIDIGCNGRISDGGVFRNCNLSDALENGLLPEHHVIVGDAAFPLKPYLMKPYGGQNLTQREKNFNYRLSRSRRIVENAFGILVSRFQIFGKPLPYCPNTVDKIVKACCALHNWLRSMKSSTEYSMDFEDTENGYLEEGTWRHLPSEGLVPIPRNMYNHSSQNARQIREEFADYFMGEGSVPWQSRMIH